MFFCVEFADLQPNALPTDHFDDLIWCIHMTKKGKLYVCNSPSAKHCLSTAQWLRWLFLTGHMDKRNHHNVVKWHIDFIVYIYKGNSLKANALCWYIFYLIFIPDFSTPSFYVYAEFEWIVRSSIIIVVVRYICVCRARKWKSMEISQCRNQIQLITIKRHGLYTIHIYTEHTYICIHIHTE